MDNQPDQPVALVVRATAYKLHADGTKTPLTLESEPLAREQADALVAALTPKEPQK